VSNRRGTEGCHGVRIYFLYDEDGSHDLPDSYLQELSDAGGQILDFHTRKGPGNRFQLNFRNHRKIVVVDGQTAWVGGHNVGDEYVGKDPEIGNWRDTHVRITGPAVLGLQLSWKASTSGSPRSGLGEAHREHPGRARALAPGRGPRSDCLCAQRPASPAGRSEGVAERARDRQVILGRVFGGRAGVVGVQDVQADVEVVDDHPADLEVDLSPKARRVGEVGESIHGQVDAALRKVGSVSGEPEPQQEFRVGVYLRGGSHHPYGKRKA
jgi:phosphatidylserine/phosphatidylglycerophosphate/cardiolipin synthase-like enzyme